MQKKTGLALFNLESDVGETTDVARDHPDVVAHLTQLAGRFRQELGDSATKEKGRGVRPPGLVP